MGNWRNNKPTSWATNSTECGATYTGHWTNLVSFFARDNRPSPTTIYSQKSGVTDLTISGAVTQDDCLRFDGTDDYAAGAYDADYEAPSTALTVATAFALRANPSGTYAWFGGYSDPFANMSYGMAARDWNTSRDLSFSFQVTGGGVFVGNADCPIPSLNTDYIAVGRWASGEAPTVELYAASTGSLVDSGTVAAVTDSIVYGGLAANRRMMLGAKWNHPNAEGWASADIGGFAAWSRKLTNQEVTDLVTDFYGPVRASGYNPPLLPFVYTVFKGA